MQDIKRRRLSLGNVLVRSTPKRIECGKLSSANIGDLVQVEGLVVEKKGGGRHLEMDDGSGSIRLTAPDSLKADLARCWRSNRITVTGRVRARPDPERSEGEKAGDIEILVERIMEVGVDSINMSAGGYASVNWEGGISPLDVTEEEKGKCVSGNILEYFKRREYTCAVWRTHDIGTTVHLVGWLKLGVHPQDRMTLQDGYGMIRLKVSRIPEEERYKIPANAIILATGKIELRPMFESNNPTGMIEVYEDQLEVLDPNKPYEKPVKTRRLNMNRFTNRSHTCGELRETYVGQKVTLSGWLEFVRMNMFFTLVIPEALSKTINIVGIPFESILKITETIVKRQVRKTNINPPAKSKSCWIPFKCQSRNTTSPKSSSRSNIAASTFVRPNLRLLTLIIMKMREFMINRCDFVVVEPPTLFRRTPGGALEFVVPTRKPDHFYSVVQSPQQFQQINGPA